MVSTVLFAERSSGALSNAQINRLIEFPQDPPHCGRNRSIGTEA